MDICGDMAPRWHKGGGITRTSEIPAPHLRYGKEGVSDPKGGPSVPRNNSGDGGGSHPRTISPTGEGDLDLDVGVVPCFLI